MNKNNAFPVVTLTNGVVVANFSSPHEFKFVDGSVLPACDPEVSRRLMLEAKEVESPGVKGTVDITLKWVMTSEVYQALKRICEEEVDVVIVPLPVMTAFKELFESCDSHDEEILRVYSKARVIRVADRVEKTIHIDRFCK